MLSKFSPRAVGAAVAVFALIGLTACNSSGGETFNSGATNLSDSEARTVMVRRINNERGQRGLPSLERDRALRQAAEAHANYLAKSGTFSHRGEGGSTAFDRVAETKYEACFVAENLSIGSADPNVVVRLWMDSAGHRRNILANEIESIGLGTASGGIYVAVFARRC